MCLGNAKKVFVLSTYCAVEITMSPVGGEACLQPFAAVCLASARNRLRDAGAFYEIFATRL